MNNEENLDKGTYCLVVNVKDNVKIKVGAKGLLYFRKGYYVYVGSALNNLSKRIIRHLSRNKKKHWHMDYLSMNKNVKINQVIYIQSIKKIECDISSYINKMSIDKIDGFGCSDCNCESHLYYFGSCEDAVNASMDAFENMNMNPKKYLDN